MKLLGFYLLVSAFVIGNVCSLHLFPQSTLLGAWPSLWWSSSAGAGTHKCFSLVSWEISVRNRRVLILVWNWNKKFSYLICVDNDCPFSNHADSAKNWNQFQEHEAKEKEVFDPFKDLNREWLSQLGFLLMNSSSCEDFKACIVAKCQVFFNSLKMDPLKFICPSTTVPLCLSYLESFDFFFSGGSILVYLGPFWQHYLWFSSSDLAKRHQETPGC